MSRRPRRDRTETDDPIARRVLSDSAYDRVRTERFSHFKQPVKRKLAVQCALLGALALALPMYALYPADAAAYVPTTDPTSATPVVLLVGAFAVALELLMAGLIAGAALSRVRNAPLTESQAAEVFDVENYATYVGYGTGGVAVVATLGLLALGLGGEATLSAYVSATSANPLRASHSGLTVAAFSTVALTGALLVLLVRGYVVTQLATLGRD